MYEYTGHMHIHSTHSDGSGTIPQIAAAARRSALDFVVITDHNTLAGQAAGEDGFRDGVLVLVGAELEVQGLGQHCLVLGLTELPPATASPVIFLDQIRERGGSTFLAHPFELGSPVLYNGRAFRWQQLPPGGFTGLEIWNYSSRWRDGCQTIPEAFLRYYLKRRGLAQSPCPLTMEKWDQLSQHRRVVAVGGSDAHAVHLKIGILRPVLFPYQDLFRGVNMHIYLRQPLQASFPAAQDQVLGALREGNSFIAYDHQRDSRGFRCICQDSASDYLPGEQIPKARGAVLHVRAPHPRCLITVLCHGRAVFSGPGPEASFPLPGAGTYRVEVHQKPFFGPPRPWIYTNPFYLT